MKNHNSVLVALLSLVSVALAQRPGYAGSHPIGYPEIMSTTTSTAAPTNNAASSGSFGNRFGNDNMASSGLPGANVNQLVNYLGNLPKDQQPYWFGNFEAMQRPPQQQFGANPPVNQGTPQAPSDLQLVNYLNSLPQDQQPVWFRDWQAQSQGMRFGSDTTVAPVTQRLPIEVNGDVQMFNNLSKLPKDQQPFWLLNWQAIEEHRKEPHTYGIKENNYIDMMSHGGRQPQNFEDTAYRSMLYS